MKKLEIQNFLKIHTVQRGPPTGVSTYAAAYRAGENLVDERTGNLYKWGGRKDVEHTEIVLPTKYHGNTDLSWARDRSTLWNKVEHSERRYDANVARDYTAVLPSELSGEQRISLARGFAQKIADRYQNAVDVAIHEPSVGRAENNHVHFLTTTREVTSDGLGAKIRVGGKDADIIKSKTAYYSAIRADFREIRTLWTLHLERALGSAGYARGAYDFVSKKSRGIAAETSPRSWLEFNTGSFLQRTLRRLARRRNRKLTQLTPSERESVKQRKKAIRSSREAELKRGRERANQRTREYHQKNREHIKQIQRKYRQRNPERIKQRSREYYQRNREHIIQRREARQASQRERIVETLPEIQRQATNEWSAYRKEQKDKDNSRDKEMKKVKDRGGLEL